MSLCWRKSQLRILDFDCEARPLSWLGGDFVTKEITAIAAKFIGEPEDVMVWLLGEFDSFDMLGEFSSFYNGADMVTGHYIRGYDLPTLNGAMLEFGLPPLSSKLAHDTKLDLVKRAGISASQESLGAMLGLEHDKVQMNQTRWREANRLTPEGLQFTRERVAGDVLQHIELRERLIDRGYMNPPRVWSSGGSQPTPTYQP